MSFDEIRDLLNRYLEGSCSPAEKAYVEKWLLENGREDNEWAKMSEEKRDSWLSDLYSDIELSVLVADPYFKQREKKAVISISRGWKAVISVAAAIVMVMGIYFLWAGLNRPALQEYRVAAGARKFLILKDGSRVWLNSRSSFRYPASFEGKTRDVYLEGEAYFEVAQDAEMPFIVHTGKLSTKVLGTHFNVRAYNNDPQISVALQEGKVQISNHLENRGRGESLILHPNELGIYKKDVKSLGKMTVSSIADYSAWKDGKLIFDETPVPEVMNRLSAIFGQKIDLSKSDMKSCTVTGTFNYKQSVEEILRTVCISLDGDFRKESGKYIISGEGCDH